MYIVNYRRRTDAVFLFFIAFLLFCIARLSFIQFFHSRYFAGIAKKQQNLFIELEARRGAIYDSNLKPQAVNISVDSLYACPSVIADKDREIIIKQLLPILQVDYAYLKERLYRKKSFIWLARKITPEQSEAIRRLNIKGLDFMKESKRCYPNGYLAGHIIGFSGLDNTGLEGLELYYNNYLKGKNGWAMILRDARQKKLNLEERMILPYDGYNLVLTIDEVIQYIAERELDKAYKAYHAKGASIVAMDPHTGAILAMANRPNFDLNEYNNADKDARRNRSICDLFEPGSVFKIVTASAALEEKKVVEEDKFFCENGSYRVATHTLHDHRPHGWLTFREVIEQSSNIGTTKVAQMLGPDTVYKYVKLFGFGAKSGVNLPGEITGSIKEPRFWSRTSIGAIPIGQEVGVTTLQLACGISVIANGGKLMKPYVVKEVRDKYGEIIKSSSPVLVRRAISPDTANRVKKILTGVIEEGTGKSARIEGSSAAGKTGTAQKLEPNGAYSHNKFIASFIGFAPAEDPVVAIAVMVDEPRPYYFGGVVAAPVFKNVAGDTLRYLKTKYPFNENLALNEAKTAN
ncbi:MAG: penicillin-binding transpeptidase domain-containing protein [Candidatus Omnitrophica bacterium]|nr:penicillin-binding transpeptidase domain-containing protein [Candidatus Omnitrophota bacterium]MDD5592312.1 penicillin-binding transpeptidase domain-containing protein [Candidatus Omnitrophota bacterium]